MKSKFLSKVTVWNVPKTARCRINCLTSSSLHVFLVGVFEEKWLVFFVSSTRSVHFFVQRYQLELRISKTYSKRQKLVQNKNIDIQNLENIGPPLVFFTRIFLAQCDFFLKFFGFHQRASPSFVSIFYNTMNLKKSQSPPFNIFRHCDTGSPFYNFEP